MYILLFIAYLFVGISQYLQVLKCDDLKWKSYYYFSFYGIVLFWPLFLLIGMYKELKD
jgi:hypothetical protein